jgi:hypothetical protein
MKRLRFGIAAIAAVAATVLAPATAGATENGVRAVLVKPWDRCEHTRWRVWDDISRDWPLYGETPVEVVHDPHLCTADRITYQDLVASRADVLILSNSAQTGRSFTWSEVAAVRRYADEGHGVLGTYALFRWGATDNRALAPIFGIKPAAFSPVESTAALDLIQLRSHLFFNISNPWWMVYPAYSLAPPDGSWDRADLAGGLYAALSRPSRKDAIVNYRAPASQRVYLSVMPEYLGGGEQEQLLYNAIVVTGR